jgi:two-component system NtrC family sensor kinase
MALRLVWVTKKTPAWVLIAAAIFLMALRRGLTLYQLLFWESPTPLDQTAELVALAVSILMVAGVASIAPLFNAIKRSEEVLRRPLIETCMDGIIANDLKGNIFIFNETAAKICGYYPEEVVGKINVRELYPPGEAREIKLKILAPALGGKGILENYETMVRHRDGTLIPIWLTARFIYEDGREVGVVGHFRDLRERKRMEEELLRNERLSALGRMAAHISHEIKNPLMLIGGFARQVLKDPAGDPEKVKEKLRIMVDEVQRLEGLLVEVGSYAKISEPQKRPGDLNALIQETCHRLEPTIQERGISLRLELDEDLPQVQFDPVHLRQVILNIAKNGIEAMPQGGTLTIASGREPGRVLVHIADTGEGIPPEVRAKIFQPFFSTKPKGSGLGLAISQKIIEAHQGAITIESETHQGTRVTFFLNLEA